MYFTNGNWIIRSENIDCVFKSKNDSKELCITSKAGVCNTDEGKEITLIDEGNPIMSVKLELPKDEPGKSFYHNENARNRAYNEAFAQLQKMYMISMGD